MFLIIISSAAFLALENVGRAKFHGYNDSEVFSVSNSLALSFGLLIQSPYAVETSKMSSRILYLSISFSTLLLFTYYTCDMTSRLTGPSTMPIKSINDTKKYGYKVVVTEGGSSADHLSHSAPQVYEESLMVESFKIPDQLMLENPGYLFYAEDSQAVTRKDILSLNIAEALLVNYAFAFQLNSEFTDLFNHHLLKMNEAGLIQRMRY